MIHTESLLHLSLHSGQSVCKSDNIYVYSTPPRYFFVNMISIYFVTIFYLFISSFHFISRSPYLFSFAPKKIIAG